MLTVLVFISCSRDISQDMKPAGATDKVFYAETPDPDVTKTYIDKGLNIYWTKDDRLSVFRSIINEKYRFTGTTGQGEGMFEKDDERVPGVAFGHNYAVYPYSETTVCGSEGKFDVSLPSIQYYSENSFGLGTNTMVAVTKNNDDDVFKFKNVCSYLQLKIYGGDRICSVRFFGNNNEKIAGAASITASYGVNPMIEMGETATTEITIDCGEEGVATGVTKENCTTFWIVLPPTVFTKGFTVEATNTSGNTKTVKTEKPLIFSRNSIKPMEAFECDTQNQRELLSFSLSDGIHSYEAFDISGGDVKVQVPNGTDMTNMKAVFSYNGAKVVVNGVEQTSGENFHDFSNFVNPVEYAVVSTAGQIRTYKIRMFNLPIVFVETPNHIEITSKDIWIENSTLKIMDTERGLVDYGTIKIKGRGNTSWSNSRKKPFTLKMYVKPQKQVPAKETVLGMPGHKKWCLLNNYACLYYGNMLGYELGRRSDTQKWAPHGRYVELFLNGEHHGTYLLAEKIEVDKNRVDIAELTENDNAEPAITGGYLLEYEKRMDGPHNFKTTFFSMPVIIQEPEEELTGAQLTYIRNYVNKFEESLSSDELFKKREYLQYFDIDAYIDVWFDWEIASWGTNSHGTDFDRPCSVWFIKDRDDKLKICPVWDFDIYFIDYCDHLVYNKCQYYGRLFQDPYFVNTVKERWKKYKACIDGSTSRGSIIEYLDSLHTVVGKAAIRDKAKWPNESYSGKTKAPEEQYSAIRQSLEKRIARLDELINALPANYDLKSGGY